jgi:hypothetical protein
LWRGREELGGGWEGLKKTKRRCAMLISLRNNKRRWTDFVIKISDEEQLFKLIVHTIKAAGYIEFCERREAEMVKALLDQFPDPIREEVIKAIRAFEAISEF